MTIHCEIQRAIFFLFDGDPIESFLGRGILRIHLADRAHDHPADGQVAVPFLVRRDDMSGSRLGTAVKEDLLEGGHVLVPVLSLGEVSGAELPVFLGDV